MDDEYKIINSPLSQKITRDGTTIDVLIFRGEHEAAWILEVVDHAGGSTVWDETFQTEQDALKEVFQTIDERRHRLLPARPGSEAPLTFSGHASR